MHKIHGQNSGDVLQSYSGWEDSRWCWILIQISNWAVHSIGCHKVCPAKALKFGAAFRSGLEKVAWKVYASAATDMNYFYIFN